MSAALMLIAAVLVGPGQGHTYKLRFSGPAGVLDGSEPDHEEWVYQYGTHEGDLRRANVGYMPESVMGAADTQGGVLRVSRHDQPGETFSFESADVFQLGLGRTSIRFEGYLDGALIGADYLWTSEDDEVYLTGRPSSLDGVWIDELRIYLEATTDVAEGIDNLTLTLPGPPAPERTP